MTRLSFFPLLPLLALAACAADPKPPEAPPAPTASPAPVPTAVVEDRRVSARVASQSPSPESAMYTRLHVVFSNPRAAACTFTGYTVRWAGGSKTFKLEGFTVPPGETRERVGRINPNDDGYAALAKIDVASIGVEVKSECPADAPPPVAEVAPVSDGTISDADLLGAAASNSVARVAMDGGVEIVAIVRPAAPRESPRLAMATVQGGKVTARRDGWNGITGLADKAIPACDIWGVNAKRQPFGARFAFVCIAGEDFKTIEETSVLLRGSTLDRLWVGPGDRAQNDMDSCLSTRDVEFSVKGKSLEKAITEDTRWTDQNISADVKARLKKACKVGKKKRVERAAIK